MAALRHFRKAGGVIECDGPVLGQKMVEMIGRLNTANRCSPGCMARFTIISSEGRQYQVSIVELVTE